MEMDMQELAACFAGIIAENRTGTPKGIRFPECRKCKKWMPKTKTCTMYPSLIPEEIFWDGKECSGMDSKEA